MKQLRSLGVAAITVLVVDAALAVSAFGAAKAAVLPSEAFPLMFSGANSSGQPKVSAAAGTLKGTGDDFVADLTSSTAGTYTMLFTNVENNKGEKCHTEGAAAGEVVMPSNSFKLVNDVSATEGVAMLLTVKLVVKCGNVEPFLTITIENENLIALLLGTGEKTTGFELQLRCSGVTTGEPKETKYWLAGVEKTALLLANFGSGFTKTCIDIQPNLALTASKMVTLEP